jgi:hypothetical protein
VSAAAHGPGSVAIRRAFRVALLGYALVLATAGVFVWGTWSANKPHEVRGEAVFWTMLTVAGLLGLVVMALLVSAWRARASTPMRASNVIPLVVACAYASLVVTFLARIGWAFVTNNT